MSSQHSEPAVEEALSRLAGFVGRAVGVAGDLDALEDLTTVKYAFQSLAEQLEVVQAENRMWRKIHDISPDTPMFIPSDKPVPQEAIALGRKLMEHYGRGSNPAIIPNSEVTVGYPAESGSAPESENVRSEPERVASDPASEPKAAQ